MTFQVREFRQGDEIALRAVFVSSLHAFARRDYAPDLIAAWEWATSDPVTWRDRLRINRPFIVESGDAIAGFADVQPSGFINQFFVAGPYGGRGVASMLMTRIHECAGTRGTHELSSHVSLRAEGLFLKWGFAVVERREVMLGGVLLPNALMTNRLPVD